MVDEQYSIGTRRLGNVPSRQVNAQHLPHTLLVAPGDVLRQGLICWPISSAGSCFLAGTIVLLLGVMTVVGTFLSDLLLLWIDPRIRVEGRR